MNRKSFTQPLVESGRLVSEAKKSSHGRVEVRDRSSRLALRVTGNGARTFITRPRFDGRPIRLTYGRLATWENYSDAKTWADRMADWCRQGIDPRIEQRKETETADRLSVRAIATDFVEKHAKKNRSWKDTDGILKQYILPLWGGRLATEVTKEDVARLLDKVEARTSVYRRNRVLACVRKLFNWAIANYDELTASPVVKGMAGKGEESRHRYLAADEIRLVWQAAGRLGYPFGPLVQMLLATGQRRGEISNMRRGKNLDVENERLWTLDRRETKAKRDHWVPLTDLALEILAACPCIDGSDLVFTTNGNTPVSGFGKAADRLDDEVLAIMREDAGAAGQDPEKVKPLPDWRLHDLRRTVATWLGELGVPPHTVGMVLNHDPKRYLGVTSIYNRSEALFERRRALTAWTRILRLMLDEEAWRKIAKLLRPETEADALATDEFRRMIQSDVDTWGSYLVGLTRPNGAENVVAIRSA